MTDTCNKRVSRRHVLAGVFGAGALAALATISKGTSFAEEATTLVAATGTLPVPEQLVATESDGVSVFTLAAGTGTDTTLISGKEIETAGYNGTFLGLTMIVSDGEKVRWDITNNLGDETTVHWHGLHIAPSADGGPQNVIEAGGTWSPETTINQGEACTLWYHPHGLGTTAEQVTLGLAGMLIVDDGSAENAALPHDYGADDSPIIMQSTAITSAGAFATTNNNFTASASTLKLLVNGFSATDTTPTLSVAYGRVRLRLLNASLTDSITLARSDGGALTQVASDAGLLAAPLSVSTLRISPGERAEIVLDLTAADTAVTLNATVRNTTNGTRYTVAMLQVGSTATTAADALPSVLNTIPALDATGATTRTFTLSNSGASMLINGIAGTTMDIMDANAVMTTLGAVEQWTITNSSTNIYHNFHLHDVPLQIVSVAGAAPTGANLGWRDTVEVVPGTSVVIRMQFTDYADNEFMYMLHCHNVIHEDDGMMLGLMVMG
ncbi:multicopper oxidase family protein [Actinoplanes couchii]|uniref:Multicopper oxidase CueO n=1 Tax=Actinoplanes couchii TaxID=403638 RepID=A0ABQ3XME3_9ACTN|nr:multicopper oxidase domain-containing protein [Actinoplanes couchii]MDR6321548.1 suppressor of ftsI/bilirubin oxidase [Actinoplanes couchii]GID59645.1 multicopper oxidase [Actinoplanes couchii]